jgi:cytoplasmic iron level regulating protein YaaA (DUF328/UPF0246 family)
MLIVLSPAKTMDFSPVSFKKRSEAIFIEEATELMGNLKKKSKSSLKTLMKLSDKLADATYQDISDFDLQHKSGKQAILTFSGDVYQGLEANEWSEKELVMAQNKMRILSGLYGVLKPHDLIQAYRFEMGTKIKIGKHPNLYSYWKGKITEEIDRAASQNKHDVILNLASNEYWKSVSEKELGTPVIKANFKEYRGEDLKFISYNAKRARGRLTRYLVTQNVDTLDGLKAFDWDDYRFDPDHSTEKEIIFTR